MQAERWLQIVGFALAVLFVAAVAFSLGVVVGRYGPGEWNPQQALGGPPGPPPGGPGRAPGAGPQGGARPGGNPLGGFPTPPQVLGRVRRIAGDSLLLATPQGLRTVTLTQETQFRTQAGQPLDRAALQPGDVVAVWGTFSAPGGDLLAETVVRLENPPQQP